VLVNKTKIGIGITAILTAVTGIINLLSAVTPGLEDRVQWLEDIFPIDVAQYGHFLTAISGFFLFILALNLWRRKRVAWLLTVILLGVSIVSNLIKGLDIEESLVSFVLLVQLFWLRKAFTAESDRPSVAQGFKVLIAALLFTLAYGTAGFYLLDTHYHVNFSLREAILQTLAMFFTDDNNGLQPKTPFGKFFADSIYGVGGVTVIYALYMLLRPVLSRGSPATEAERLKAKEIVEKYGCTALARFTLFEDKSYYFSPSGQSTIAYVPKGRGAIALGDPIGPMEDLTEAIRGFQMFCQKNDWYPGFYQTLPNHLDTYRQLGFKSLKIGEDAIIDLKAFSIQGKSNKNLRNAINKFTKMGYKTNFYKPPISNELYGKLKDVSDEWLKHTQGSEKKFSLGWFNEAYIKDCEIITVETDKGDVTAFANVVPEYQSNEITIDLMRKRQEVETGTMDFLFLSMFSHFKDRGFHGFNMGLSALSGVGGDKSSPRLEKVLSYLYKHLNQFYNFQGLHFYKDKFNPNWEPRYLVYPNNRVLPDVVISLIRADSGDRILDYFKPET
jgi:phosphatidylglycerol lysyltransferase